MTAESIVQRLTTRRVGDVMTRQFWSVATTDKLADVSHELIERGLSAAPVLRSDGALAGIITKTDLLKEKEDVDPQLTVEAAMTPVTYSLTEDATVADATAALGFEGIHHLPVLNAQGKISGMLSSLDLLAEIASALGYQQKRGAQGLIFARNAS
ncbi:MAG: CBS domain-containing protein [Deltaproteobacteria bacterium]|nr:CBS domain-containing protein [Deltaproteobacteria bacterium]